LLLGWFTLSLFFFDKAFFDLVDPVLLSLALLLPILKQLIELGEAIERRLMVNVALVLEYFLVQTVL
jgi:hypothetical protein